MTDLTGQGQTAGKLIEFEMLQNIAEDDTQHASDYKMLFQGQGKILLALTDQDGLSQKALVERLNLTPQSTAEFVRKLEKRGLVTRTKSTADKRVTIVRLTTAGRAEIQKRTRSIPSYLRVLSPQELNQFNHILDKINGQMYQDIQNANPSLHHRYHQFMLNQVLNKVHPE
ncbi:transcriptional regulator [Lactobacillus sp. PFC-70]|nr:transcriptional regulator [Lactobacillus sp. PFC-70]